MSIVVEPGSIFDVPNNANTFLAPVIAIPSSLQITAISQSNPMVITYSVNPNTASFSYIVGQLVKLTIPNSYGMQQANNIVRQIVSIGTGTVSLNIDSTNFDPFSAPSSGEQPASFSPYGSQNLQYSNATNSVAFQSLNNVGN